MATQGLKYAWIKLNMPQKYLNMQEYDLIMLNLLEYACIYLNKQSSEFWMCLMQYIRSLYKLLSNYQDRSIFRTLPHI